MRCLLKFLSSSLAAMAVVSVVMTSVVVSTAVASDKGRNVRDYGAIGDGIADDTKAIQAAIDAGGLVHFPEGVYLSGSLYLRSDGGLDLDPGAVLKSHPDLSKWDVRPVCQERESFTTIPTSSPHFICCVGQTNVVIRGGTIDGNVSAYLLPTTHPAVSGRQQRDKVDGHPRQMVWFIESSRITVENVSMRESPMWNLFLHGCDDVIVRGLRINSRADVGEDDGIDIDCCSRVSVSDCRIDVGDDGITIRGNTKGLSFPRPCENVAVSNCVVRSDYAHAVRIGVGSGRIRNCVFGNVDIRDSRGGIWVCNRYSDARRGVDIEDVTFDDVRVQATCGVFIRHDYKFVNPDRPFEGVMRNILFRNVSGSSRLPLVQVPNGRAVMEGVRFVDCRMSYGRAEDASANDRQFFQFTTLPVSFRWKGGVGKDENVWKAGGLPEIGPYSVRFRAALLDAHGTGLSIVADGVEFRCNGDAITTPGRKDAPKFRFTLRNRRYHDFMFVCRDGAVRFWGDGDEYAAMTNAACASRGFSIAGGASDLDVTGLEVSRSDMTDAWSVRNQVVNGGFEELCNDGPIAWSTFNFGFFKPKEIVGLNQVWKDYHVDHQVAYEGTNSMFVASRTPVWECWRNRIADEDYVFSVYAKATVPGTKFRIAALEMYREVASKTLFVGTEWQRFELPFHTKTGVNLACQMQRVDGGGVWMDAVQLERGTMATRYVARQVPTEAVSPDSPAVMDHYYSRQSVPQRLAKGKVLSKRVDPVRNSYRLADGEYFAYGFCGVMDEHDPETYVRMLDLFRKWGFNYFEWMGNGKYPTDPDTVRGFLDAAEERGIKTVIYLRKDKNSLAFEEKGLALVKEVADHPNLLAIGVLDEVYGSMNREDCERMVRELRRMLPVDVPIRFNEFDRGVINHAQNGEADIASGDFYVVGEQEVSAFYYLLRLLKEDHPDQMVSFYPMAAGHFFRWLRDPTPDEVIAQAYMGYSLELFNVTWWMAVPMTFRTVIPAMIQAKRERDLINPSKFLDGTPYAITCRSRNNAIKFAARTTGGKSTVIAINIENRENEAEWTLPCGCKGVRAIIGNAPNRVTGRTIKDVFAPLERRVYEISNCQ